VATDRPRRLWRRCRRIVDGLELPDPFEATVFIAALARTRGRPITLMPLSLPPHTPCGLLVSTDSSDYIVYAADTTYLHQQHILLHEAAHLICGHDATSPAVSPAAQVLAPHLPPGLVQRVLGRAVYAEPQEQEAELVASLILTRAAHLARTATADPSVPVREASGPQRLFGAPRDRTQQPYAADGP
jgi:hypothetical protein